MSNRKLIILSIVAALMIVWAVIQSHIGGAPARAPSGPSYLIQGLDPGRIASIIIGTGENAARLVRQGDRFVVGNKDNYPAVISKINELITSCLDIRTVGLITSNPANHDDLEVSEGNAKNIVIHLGPPLYADGTVGSIRHGTTRRMSTTRTSASPAPYRIAAAQPAITNEPDIRSAAR